MRSMTENIVCARPGCNNPLNTGSMYCGRRCAALDRKRVKARRSSLSGLAQGIIPQYIADPMVAYLGEDAYAILDEFAITLAEMQDMGPPPLLTRVTEAGDNDPVETYGVLHKGKATYRPTDALGFDTIDEMLRNGQVQFAMAMKESWLLSVFRNDRSYKVECKDEKLASIVQGSMKRVLMRHASDFTKAMPYGVGFFEKVWDYLPAVQWGIEGVPDGEKIYSYKSVDAIHPKSIDRILYTDDGKHYAGFVQKPSYGEEIEVPAERSLTLTYDKRFRNLWGIPMLEPSYVVWFWYEVALRSFLRYLERMGTPVAVCEAPSRGQVRKPDGTRWRTMKYAMLVAGNVGKSSAIALPSDVDPDTGQKLWNLSYLSADQRGTQFVEAIEMLGTLVIRSVVIGDRAVTQGSEVGSYAAANKHFQVTMLHNEHILTQFVNQFNSYLIPQLAQYNIGANAPPALMVTEGLDPDEKDRLFTLLNTMGNQADTSAMEYIDWKRIFEVENIPVLSEEDVEKLREDKLAREEERMTMQQKFATKPEDKAPFGKKAKSPKDKAKEKVKASADWMLYNLIQGQRVPLVLSSEQALGIAERFSPEPFKLFNPYHDELGRFTTAQGAGSPAGYPSKGVLQRAYDGLSPAVQKVIAAPAEYLSRKGKFQSALRIAIEVASDIGINRMVSGLIMAGASSAGAAATAAITMALFGAVAAPATVLIGGLIVGFGATIAVSEFLDYGQTKVFHAYLNRYSPKDDAHIQFTHIPTWKKATKVATFKYTVLGTFFDAIMFMSMGDFDIEALKGVGLEEADSPDRETRLFTAAVWPFVLDLLMADKLDVLVFPYVEVLDGFPGFMREGDMLIMDKDGARVFAERWATGSFPNIDKVEFGNTDVVELPMDQEEEIEAEAIDSITLFNPYHDELGRFAVTPGGVAARRGTGEAGVAKEDDINLSATERATLKRNINEVVADLRRSASGPFSLDISPMTSQKEFADMLGTSEKRSRNVFGFMDKEQVLRLSPAVTESMAGRPRKFTTKFLGKETTFSAEQFRKVSETTVAHEILHTRRRENPITYDRKGFITKDYALLIEEGATELLTQAWSVKTGRMSIRETDRFGAYTREIAGLAKEARARYPNSPGDALRWVTYAHKTGFTPKGIQKSFGGLWYSRKGWKAAGMKYKDEFEIYDNWGKREDVDWLLRGAKVEGIKLEEEQEGRTSLLLAMRDRNLNGIVEGFKSDSSIANWRMVQEFLSKCTPEERDKLLEMLETVEK